MVEMTYRAGIIGAGGIAGLGILGLHNKEDIGEKRFPTSHAGGYAANDDVELVAVADIDSDKLATFGDVWELDPSQRYSDHRTMIAEEDLDIVSVCTPSLYHGDHVLDAARADNSPDVIWCEKPIASNVQEAEQMSAVCRDRDIELVINHSFRFSKKYQQLRSLIAEGQFGDIVSVSAMFRRELLRNSTHLLDTLIFLLDGRAQSVTGYINGENDAVDALSGTERVDDSGGGGMMVLQDGTFVTVDCTMARDISSMCFQFIGTEGKLYLNNDDGEWRYWRLEKGEHIETPLPGIDEPWDWSVDYRLTFPRAVSHLVDVLDGAAENISPGPEATRSLETIVGFYISHYTGSQVSIPLEEPLKDVTITSW